MYEGQRPLSVGSWFSLGHSTIVFVLAFLLSLGMKALAGPVTNDDSQLHDITGWIGTTVSGAFLYLIAIINLVIMAGMSLLDTIDGSFMNFAYGWAFSKPVRKVYYNLTVTVTGLSVAVALIVIGYVVVGLFFATWAIALLVWKAGRIEEKWTAGMAHGPTPAGQEPIPAEQGAE